MLICATSRTIRSRHLNPFLLIRLHTLVFAKDHNSSVFCQLRPLQSKTSGVPYPQHSILPAPPRPPTLLHALTPHNSSARVPRMVKAKKSSSSSATRGKAPSKSQKRKPLAPVHPPQRGGVEMVDPRVQAQMKIYDEALGLFHQQKFQRAKQELEKVIEGPSKELADRARMHVKIAEQRMKPSQEQNPRTFEEHYQRGVAMMNLRRWADARESLDKA